MTNEATGQAEQVRTEVLTANNPRAGAEFITSFPTREVLPAFFSVITSDILIPQKLDAIRNVKAALDDPEGSGLRERAAGATPTVTSLLSTTKEVVVNLSPQAQSTLSTIRTNFEHYMKGSSVRTLNGTNSRILTEGVDGKYLTQAVMAVVFNRDESLQFRQTIMNTFLTSSPNPTFEAHYFGPDTSYGQIDFTRERDRQAEETRAARLGRRAGRAWRRRGELPGEALGRVRAQLLREQAWEQGIINRTREAILTPPRRARTLLGRGAGFVRSAPGRLWNRAGEVTGPRARGILNGATGAAGRILHGVSEVPGRVGNFAFGRFRRHPAQPAQHAEQVQPQAPEVHVEAVEHEAEPTGPTPEPPLEGEFVEQPQPPEDQNG